MRAPGRESSLAPALEESASGISRRSNPDQKEDPVVGKIPPQDLRDAENEMPVGNLLENEGTEPFPEFHRTVLMVGGTEMTVLPGEGQEIFMVAIPALHPGRTMVQASAFQVAVNDLLKVGTPKPARPFELSFVDLNKGRKMVFHAPVIIGRLRVRGRKKHCSSQLPPVQGLKEKTHARAKAPVEFHAAQIRGSRRLLTGGHTDRKAAG